MFMGPLDDKLEKTLILLGHKESQYGTDYLREAIPLYRRGCSMMRDIYGVIADRYGCTTGSVERAMRYSIATAWPLGWDEAKSKYFGNIAALGAPPTTREYIARLARFYNAN